MKRTIDQLPDNIRLAPCECCGEPTLPLHHKYPNTKSNKKEFGEVIDWDFNKQFICAGCNTSHAGHGKGLIVWKRDEFLKGLLEYLKKYLT